MLEARRHLPNGRDGGCLAAAGRGPAVLDQGRSLARRFERWTGVAVEVLQGGLAPESSDVYDYLEPTVSGGSRLLFSIQLKPPTQAAAHELAFRAAVLRLLGMGAGAAAGAGRGPAGRRPPGVGGGYRGADRRPGGRSRRCPGAVLGPDLLSPPARAGVRLGGPAPALAVFAVASRRSGSGAGAAGAGWGYRWPRSSRSGRRTW
ncbi:MAG: hypothetical protein R2882_14740 [Gemmatimonadales bacterium]